MDIIMIGEVREKQECSNSIAPEVIGHEIMQTVWTRDALIAVKKSVIEIPLQLSEDKQIELSKITYREKAIEQIKDNGDFLFYLNYTFQDDEEIVKIAMQNNVYNLRYASDRIKSNPEIVLAAIKSEKEIYYDLVFQTCASESLKNEVDSRNAVYYLEKKIFNDKLQKSIPEKLHVKSQSSKNKV